MTIDVDGTRSGLMRYPRNLLVTWPNLLKLSCGEVQALAAPGTPAQLLFKDGRRIPSRLAIDLRRSGEEAGRNARCRFDLADLADDAGGEYPPQGIGNGFEPGERRENPHLNWHGSITAQCGQGAGCRSGTEIEFQGRARRQSERQPFMASRGGLQSTWPQHG